MNLYEELGLHPSCSQDDIKQQFRILANKHHPDKGGDVEVFKRIKLAYEVLGDPKRRAEYDKTGNTAETKSHRTEAIEQLSGIFLRAINNFDVHTGDLVLNMKNEVNNMRQTAINDQLLCQVYINNLQTANEKLKNRSDEQNLLHNFLLKQIEQRQQEFLLFSNRIQTCNIMLQILDQYHYGFFELPQS
jgi:curved DNA-binding protein CbpA